MKSFLDRRSFVTSLGAATMGVAMLGAGRVCLAAREARGKLVADRLADHLLLVRGAGANVVVARDATGLAFADGGLAGNSSALLSLAQRELGAKQVHSLVNTHWHREHTGLNEHLGRRGAKIIAHENTRLWLSTTVRMEPDAAPFLPLPASARPNATTYTTGELTLGDETARFGYLPQAHTDGDLYVYFAKANVLVTGGVVAGNGWPTADWVTGGWINGTVAGYKTLIDLCNDSTRVVTAHGERLFSRADLQSERDMLAKLADQLGKMMRAGFGPADMLAADPAREYVAKMGDPTRFLTESFKSMWPRMAPDA
jgi:glyoxylase-like metal-dependent hydrolase (beta-lactamase superfamily II)